MSLLNLVWQGIGIMREETTNFEKKLNSCSGINDIREVVKKTSDVEGRIALRCRTRKNINA